jgi:hypothetical protein
MGGAENSRTVQEIRKGNIQTAVVAKNYLEGFDPQISGTDRAHHTFATDGIDVSGLKSLHSWNCSTGVESVGYQNRYERMRSVA